MNVANGKGTKTVIIKDNKGIHSNTIRLKNIKQHKFMPKLFNKSMQIIKRKKTKTMKHTSKKGTHKSK